MKAKEAADADEPVVDPYTVKIRRFPNEVTEFDLKEILEVFGEVVRCKIPMDFENNCNKGIGFVTFKTTDGCKEALAKGFIKYDVFEYPVE